jgi:hypothetical protein
MASPTPWGDRLPTGPPVDAGSARALSDLIVRRVHDGLTSATTRAGAIDRLQLDLLTIRPATGAVATPDELAELIAAAILRRLWASWHHGDVGADDRNESDR